MDSQRILKSEARTENPNPMRPHPLSDDYIEALTARVAGYKPNTHAVLMDTLNTSVFSEQRTRFHLFESAFTWVDENGKRHSVRWCANPNAPPNETPYVLMFDKKGGIYEDEIRYVLYKGLDTGEVIANGSTDKYANFFAIVDNPRRGETVEPFLVAFAFARDNDGVVRSGLLKGFNENVREYIAITGIGDTL